MRRPYVILAFLSACSEPVGPTLIDAPDNDEPSVDAPAIPPQPIPGLFELRQHEVVLPTITFRGSRAFGVFGDHALPKPFCDVFGLEDIPFGPSAGTIHITGPTTFDVAPKTVDGGFLYSKSDDMPEILFVGGETFTATVEGAGDIAPFQITATAPALPVATIPPMANLPAGPYEVTWTPGAADAIEIEVDMTDNGEKSVKTTCVVADTGRYDLSSVLASSPHPHAIISLAAVRETTTSAGRLRLLSYVAGSVSVIH